MHTHARASLKHALAANASDCNETVALQADVFQMHSF